MASTFAKLLPPSVRARLSRRRERRLLARCERIACDASALRSITPEELTAIFQSPTIAAHWDVDSKVLSEFAIPEEENGVTQSDRQAIYYLVSALRPRRILEIGTGYAGATLGIALALKRIAAESGEPCGELVTVDSKDVNHVASRPWLAHGCKFSPKQMVDQIGCERSVWFVLADGVGFLRNSGPPFDLVILGGDRAAEVVYRKIPPAFKRLQAGGLLAIYDYFPGGLPLWSDGSVVEGPYLATERLFGEGASFVVEPLGKLPWPTRFGEHATSLAVISAAVPRG